MTQKIRAYKVNAKNLKQNTIPNYNDLSDGVSYIAPVKIRNNGSYGYHVAEDVKGDIYLIEDFLVTQYKLYDRNLSITDSNYLLDGVGISQIKIYKKTIEQNTLQNEKEVVESNIEVSSSNKDEEQERLANIELMKKQLKELRNNKGVKNDENI